VPGRGLDGDVEPGAGAELGDVLAQRGHQAGVVQGGGAQVGADLADAGGGVGEQGGSVFQHRRELHASGCGEGVGQAGEEDLQRGEIGAGAVVQRAGELAAFALLNLDQVGGELLEAGEVLQALGFHAPALGDVLHRAVEPEYASMLVGHRHDHGDVVAYLARGQHHLLLQRAALGGVDRLPEQVAGALERVGAVVAQRLVDVGHAERFGALEQAEQLARPAHPSAVALDLPVADAGEVLRRLEAELRLRQRGAQRVEAARLHSHSRPARGGRSTKRAGSIASHRSRSSGRGSPSSWLASNSAASADHTRPRAP